MTIAEFILARIDEDQAVARECSDPYVEGNWRTYENDIGTIAMTKDRALAECQAKRAIVESTNFSDVRESAVDRWMQPEYADLTPPPAIAALAVVLKHLAAVYSDHPDYDEEWRP